MPISTINFIKLELSYILIKENNLFSLMKLLD